MRVVAGVWLVLLPLSSVWATPPTPMVIVSPSPCAPAVPVRQETSQAVIYSARQSECPPSGAQTVLVPSVRSPAVINSPVILRSTPTQP